MKILSLIFFFILAFSVEAKPQHKLDFREPVRLKKVIMKSLLPTNLLSLYKDFHYQAKVRTLSSL